MSAPVEEVFVDASYGQASESLEIAEEMMLLRSSKVLNQVHAFMNVSAVLAILCFVAVQRNKSIDLSSMFIQEPKLKPAFETLCQ